MVFSNFFKLTCAVAALAFNEIGIKQIKLGEEGVALVCVAILERIS